LFPHSFLSDYNKPGSYFVRKMRMDETFYLGRQYDLQTGKTGSQLVLYDPADLTTHAVVTGMTGSGKTGLCIALMEEAALQGIPAIIIDPKGDLTNLLLHFPGLAPADFQPWLDAESVRRRGVPLEQAAAEAAAKWREGLAEWGIEPDRLRALAESTRFSVFTPGSDAGLKVSVVSSLEAPPVPWEGTGGAAREDLRHRDRTTRAGGMETYPAARASTSRSPASSSMPGAADQLDLDELILQTQTPPFEKLGAFQVDAFFPPKARTELAMLLNNIHAAPSFETWRGGPRHALDAPDAEASRGTASSHRPPRDAERRSCDPAISASRPGCALSSVRCPARLVIST
jgi:hypothetical protein